MGKKRSVYIAQDVPQLANAIFAVTEWAENVASRNDLEEYFFETERQDGGDGEKVGPLRTIIVRVLLYQPRHNQRLDPSTLTVGCANLITTVLLSPACKVKSEHDHKLNGAAQSSAMKKILGELLGMGRTLAFQMKTSSASARVHWVTPKHVAKHISNCILDLLQRASKEKRTHERRLGARRINVDARCSAADGFSVSSFSSQDQAGEIVRRLEIEVNALTSKQGSRYCAYLSNIHPQENFHGGVVLNMLVKRDRMKKMADKLGMVLEISLWQGAKWIKNNRKTGVAQNAHMDEEQQLLPLAHFQSSEAKHELVQKIIGTSLHSSIASSMNEVQSLKNKVEKLHAETSCEQSFLSSRLRSISSKRKVINQRMDELQQELEELEMQDQQLAQQESNAMSELGRLEIFSEREMKGFEGKINSKVGYVALDRAVQWTVEKIVELEGAWIRSFFSSDATFPASILPQSKISISSLVPLKLDQYLHYAHSYFQIEAQSIESLRKRVLSMEAHIFDLECELQPCFALGMSNNVDLMSDDLRTLKSHVNEDNLVIDVLMNDVKEMWLDLIRRVEEYCWSMIKGEQGPHDVIDTETLRPSHIMFLEGISIELTGIESNFDSDGRMGSIFSKKINFRPASGKPSSSHTAVRVAELPTLTRSTNGKSLSTPLVMPKFSWANKTNNMLRKVTKSLLDIQREEMLLSERRNPSTMTEIVDT
mmetsp:Transcript_24868/g.44757  ORF Transcript_24868/g.44757 Transcript_24868/m.44757 type:complete len:709 (+) Transcript_24868:63-2189(+)